MTKKITQQDIADAMQLSRNTVSKALNNEPGLKDETRAQIIQQAIAMGYTKFPPGLLDRMEQLQHQQKVQEPHTSNRLIALLSHSDYVGNHYWSTFIKGLNASLKEHGYTAAMTLIDESEEDQLLLPALFSQHQPAGIIMIGSFLRAYYERIESTGIPSLFVDTYAEFTMNNLKTDTLLVNNRESVYELTKHLIENGYRSIGFVGDVGSCLSYKERYEGFQQALRDSNLDINPALHIVNHLPRHYYYMKQLREELQTLKVFPRVFVCANDSIAADLIVLLREMGKLVPEDIVVTGFDNTDKLAYLHPAIPTIDVPKEQLGIRAGEQLIWRIANPDRPRELIRLAVQANYAST